LIVKETLSRSLNWLDRRLTPVARYLPEALKAPLRLLVRGPARVPVRTLEPAHPQAAEVTQTADTLIAAAPAAAVSEPVAVSESAAAAPESVDAAPPAPSPPATDPYAERLRREQEIFADQIDVNALPRIFHYWSHTYLRPKLQHFGCSNPDEFFANALEKAMAATTARPARFVSLGAGNCDTEVRVAQILVGRGLRDFVIECLDINAAMLQRGAALAREAGVATQVVPLPGDFNDWRPAQHYDAAMANQSLHHVLQLESLFDAVLEALTPQGVFVVSDMVGRNGHQRWPEALAIVREFWKELPERYRYHVQLREQWQDYVDFDCSGEGFEGIRAQDILPLLMQRFRFERFCAFGNVIDPFIDRGFGPHFDADSARDLALIDRIHARDEQEIEAGSIKPTHLMAVMRKPPYDQPPLIWKHLSPEHCARPPG
jgi:SAM-dependent methyltransferase